MCASFLKKLLYERPQIYVFEVSYDEILCGSPESGQSESIRYEDLFNE